MTTTAPNDSAHARKLQRRKDRAARAQAWADKVSFDIQLTWPRDTLGRVIGLIMLLAPTGLLMLGARLARWRPLRSSDALQAIVLFVVTLVVGALSFGLQAIGTLRSWPSWVVVGLFCAPSVFLLVTAFVTTRRPRRAANDVDEPGGAP